MMDHNHALHVENRPWDALRQGC